MQTYRQIIGYLGQAVFAPSLIPKPSRKQKHQEGNSKRQRSHVLSGIVVVWIDRKWAQD